MTDLRAMDNEELIAEVERQSYLVSEESEPDALLLKCRTELLRRLSRADMFDELVDLIKSCQAYKDLPVSRKASMFYPDLNNPAKAFTLEEWTELVLAKARKLKE